MIAFWLPIPPGIIAFFQLRSTVNRWEREGVSPGAGVRGPEAASRIVTDRAWRYYKK